MRCDRVDQYPPADGAGLAEFFQADLNTSKVPVDAGAFDYVWRLDAIEYLRSPETFVDSLRRFGSSGAAPTLIVATGNIEAVTRPQRVRVGAERIAGGEGS